MIQPILTGDRGEAAVIGFDSDVRILQDFTTDSGQIEAALSRIHEGPQMSGRLIDAVEAGVGLLAARAAGRKRVLVTISESAIAAAGRSWQARCNWSSAKTSRFMPPRPGGPSYLDAVLELARMGTKNTTAAVVTRIGGGRAQPLSPQLYAGVRRGRGPFHALHSAST
jgi:hypothetical protein